MTLSERDIELLLSGPYADPPRWQRLVDRVGRQARASLAPWLKRNVRCIERALLAVGYAQAQAQPTSPARVLAQDVIPPRVFRGLPRPRKEYLAVVMAATRCQRELGSLFGQSRAMQDVRASVWRAGFGASLWDALRLGGLIHDHDLLISGETGTGKEVVARALLAACPAVDEAPTAAVNVAAVPETLIDSELFGHVKGAFTGAASERQGHIRRAHGGALFLDEVGDLPLPSQVKLLRVMETDQVLPVGSDVPVEASVRYISATHRDLEAMVDAGRFRRDLYQRIADQVISLPPLRDRPEDIEPIGLAFVERYLADVPDADDVRERATRFLRGRAVRRHPFVGNVRELETMLRGVMLGAVPRLGSAAPEASTGPSLPAQLAQHRATWRDVEDWYLGRVLEHTEHNYSAAARLLEVSRSTVVRRAREL